MDNRPEDKREVIGFIGAGRLGTALARQFFNQQYAISTIIDIDVDKAQRCQKKYGGRVGSEDVRNIDPETTILFITVPDEDIEQVGFSLSKYNILKPGMIVTHTSGLLSSDSLRSLRDHNIRTCSFHPCYSFPENHEGSLKDVFFALEGDREGCNRLEKLIRAIGGKPFFLSKEEKALYHAGCTMASNYLVALLDMVQFVMDRILTGDNIEKVLPLIKGTIENIEQRGVQNALTGPILRGDITTIEKHIKSLEACNANLISPYIILGKATLKMAIKLGLDEERGRALESIFNRHLEHIK